MKTVEASIAIKASPAAIIAAFTDAEMLSQWWGVERSLVEKKIGGLYTLAWNITENGFGYVSSGTIKEYQPEALLVVENLVYLNPGKPILGPMTLTVKAIPNGKTTCLYLCQAGYLEGPDWDWYYDVVKQAWPVVLETIKKYLEQVSS